MVWEHLSVTTPHLTYLILGGFTTLFMLCSSVIKERLYIGEATVATICGIIFGPHAANVVDPTKWGNSDLITLEFSRIVLVVQCFAVGVELPKAYMERHWRSVVFLLVPVMTFGWLITSLFIWGLWPNHLNWLDSLCIAACVTATDPVLASSVVGKGKFAKRVPKHLRDLLSAESGCNDGMAFPFVYLAVYLIRYRPDANKVSYYWFLYTILYECLFGAIFGVTIGYMARRAIRFAHKKDWVDRESFLVFYFVLALFCAGSGSLLGMDDLLVGFAAGVGFSNDGWFTEKTEESHVSNVIDLLINLAFFVYFGAIIPWEQFNSQIIGLVPWKLVVLGLLVLFFRRLPIMLALKPVIPDIKTWREAMFAGHFGPIGVGGLFIAILARAELETESTTPLAELPPEGFEHLNIIEMIWPITVFLVIVSIVVHGSSIAVFTLGKHINTLTLTMSYTQANDDSPNWMDRLPRIQSRSKSMMSSRRNSESQMDEKNDFPPGTLGPIGVAGGFLRRQKDENSESRSSSLRPTARRRRWDSGRGPGGPISQSAIAPVRREDSDIISPHPSTSESTAVGTGESSPSQEKDEPEEEVYREGDEDVIEDEEGNVLDVRDAHGESREERKSKTEADAKRQMKEKHVEHGVAEDEHSNALGDSQGHEHEEASRPGPQRQGTASSLAHLPSGWKEKFRRKAEEDAPHAAQRRGAARAYQFGNTIIVEDEDGEVLKKYDIPGTRRPGLNQQGSFIDQGKTRLANMGKYLGMHHHKEEVEVGEASKDKKVPVEDEDKNVRFTMMGGRRMSKQQFIEEIQKLDPKSRMEVVEDTNVPETVKREARAEAKEHMQSKSAERPAKTARKPSLSTTAEQSTRTVKKRSSKEDTLADDADDDSIPTASNLQSSLASRDQKETAANRRRREANATSPIEENPESPLASSSRPTNSKAKADDGETAAERRRREGALGMTHGGNSEDESEGEDDGTGMRDLPPEWERVRTASKEKDRPGEDEATSAEGQRRPGIKFADAPRQPPAARLRWGVDVGNKPGAGRDGKS